MAVTKNPKRKRGAGSGPVEDERAEKFISGAGEAAETPAVEQQAQAPQKRQKQMTTLRFDPELLRRIDAAAARHGISRAAWISYTLSRVLDDEDVE